MSLEDFFVQCFGLSDQTILSELTAISTYSRLPAGSELAREGKFQPGVLLLVEGIVRSYYFDEHGDEKTECFLMKPGTPVLAGIDFEQPAWFNMEAVTDVSFVTLPFRDVWRLIEKYSDVMRVYNRLLVEAFSQQWEQKRTVDRYSAIHRYQWFLEHYPGLSGLVSQKQIASLLDMTPVTLSRVKKALRAQDGKLPERAGTGSAPELQRK